MINLYIIGTKEFIADIKEQIQQTAVQIDLAGVSTDPSSGCSDIDKNLTHIDAVLIGLPQEQVESFIDILTRDEVKAAVFVSVENIATEYKKWAKYKAWSAPKGMEIQNIINYFGNKVEQVEEPVIGTIKANEDREKRANEIKRRETESVDHEGIKGEGGLKNILSKGKELLGRTKETNDNIVYVSHALVAVWNPAGGRKAEAALGLAHAAGKRGFNTVLAELDLTAPLLDFYFNIPQTGVENEVKGAGIMTLGENMQPDYAPKLLIKKRYYYYLPAGNKLGNLGTPDYSVELVKDVLHEIYHRKTNRKPAVTVIDTASCIELPVSIATLQQATVVVVPVESDLEAELLEHQLTELQRLGIEPELVEVVCKKNIKKVCEKRVCLSADSFISVNKKEDWDKLLQEIV